MARTHSHAGVLGHRTFLLALLVVCVLALLWFGLLFMEHGGASPVHTPLRLIGSQNTTTSVAGTTTTVPMGNNSQNCNDNDQHVGEGTPADLNADMSNGNGTGGDGCPSGI
jgi:hypothetical protein